MTQAIMQAATKAMKTAVQAMTEAAGLTKRNNAAATTQSMSVMLLALKDDNTTGSFKLHH